ncbi:Zinc-binding dehydrogenase-like protein 18 [Elsinoe fawcettii]|nr:Zinc-binding dehydrogenase-like protein 18 [Elsinoe fawcettii]
MTGHSAIATVAKRTPLIIIKVPTVAPRDDEVLVKNEYTTMGPLELHQGDGGLLVKHPQILGDAVSGTVIAVGSSVSSLSVGDKVFGFTGLGPKEKAYQTCVTAQATKFGKLPHNISQQEAATMPTNLVTAFHTIVTDLGLSLPWPKPEGYTPEDNRPILVWGASSSVGQYCIQVLKYYGYIKVLAVASKRQHQYLKSLGAIKTFDYSEDDVVSQLKALGSLPYIIDCIGSQDKSLALIAQIAQSGAKVAIMLPVIVRDATETEEPIYEMDVQKAASWSEGVDARGVRTHFWQQNEFHARNLQSVIVPKLVAEGIIRPNRIREIEGENMLERAEKALSLLRNRVVRGEKLVFALDDEGLHK